MPDELPGEDPQTTDNAVLVGLHRTLDLRRLPYMDFAAGIRVRTPPVAVVGIVLQREFTSGPWVFVPTLRGFWLSDDGFGEVQALRVDRWMHALEMLPEVSD